MRDTFIVKSRISEIPGALDRVAAFGKNHELSEEMMSEIRLVIEEVVSNIIFYGYDDDQIHDIELKLELAGTMLRIQVEDGGRPFNPVQHAGTEKSGSLEEYEHGGMGLQLVRGIMDDISYVFINGRNRLLMGKNLI